MKTGLFKLPGIDRLVNYDIINFITITLVGHMLNVIHLNSILHFRFQFRFIFRESTMAESVKVAVRVRPFNQREKDFKSTLIIGMDGNQTTISDPNLPDKEPRKFAFDYSYWSHDGFNTEEDGTLSPTNAKYADQKRVFDDLGLGVLDNAWKGFNCSLFAYGQTGSGKSYSMVGFKYIIAYIYIWLN